MGPSHRPPLDRDPAGFILDKLMMLFGFTEREMGKALGISHTSVQNRRKVETDMKFDEVIAAAEFFGVDATVFSGTAVDALVRLVTTHPDFRWRPGVGEGG